MCQSRVWDDFFVSIRHDPDTEKAGKVIGFVQ